MKTLVLSAALAFASAAQADTRLSPGSINGDAALNSAMVELASFIADRNEADAIFAGLATSGTAATDVPAFVLQAEARPVGSGQPFSSGRDLDSHLAAFNEERIGAEEPAMFRLQYSANAAFSGPVQPAEDFGTTIHDGRTLEQNLAELEERMIRQGDETYRETVAAISGQSFDKYVAALALY
jgi:hypothetical protein